MGNDNIPVVIMCGGQGTRIREETEFKPKPMIKIGDDPILVHIMRWYAKFGFNEFVLALGYKQEIIKQYFRDYRLLHNDVVIQTGSDLLLTPNKKYTDDFLLTLSNTGEATLKGGRLKRLAQYICTPVFMMTYGDSIGDINIRALLDFHMSHGKMATVTGVTNPLRFGELTRDGSLVTSYSEKPHHRNRLINGGFYVFNREIFDYLTADKYCDLEPILLKELAEKGQLHVFEHHGQWNCLDTAKDLGEITQLYESRMAKWRIK